MKSLGVLSFHTASLVFWFLVLFHGGSVRDKGSLCVAAVTTTSWSTWGRWSDCNTKIAGRRSRSRNCVNSRGITQSASNCDGPAQRTRQCESCAYPVLNRGRKSDSRLATGVPPSWNISSTSFRQMNSKTAWCSSSQKFSSGQEYLEIEFKTALKLTGIGTRGHRHNSAALSGFVTEYKLVYSFDGARWFAYTDDDGDVLLRGNVDTVRLRRNNLDSAFVMRYLRVYPTKYHSRSCIDLELYGCVYNCGGLITENPMRISTPNAALFTEEPECLWLVDSKVATKFLLMFPFFKLLCRDGFLGVRDGSSPFLKAELLEELCGESRTPSPLSINGNQIWLHYKTNATTEDIGFRLHVNTIVMETMNATNGVVTVKVPKSAHGYAQWYRYVWFITMPQNGTIEFTIHDFTSQHKRLENGKCIRDFVVLYERNEQGMSPVGRYCGDDFPKVVECKGGLLRVKFRANTDHPKWKLHFSFRVRGSELSTEVSPTNRSTGNGTLPVIELEKKWSDNSNESASKTPVIIASILAAVIASVFLVALIHFLRKRKAFLKKHPYDCNSTRPMSHFGDEDSTPFINTNVLMWSDSNSRDYEKLKAKNGKNTLPFVTVALREDGPQRLSFISPDMVSGNSEPSLEADVDEAPLSESLIVSDAFTEECMELLYHTLTSPLQDPVSENSDEQRDTDSQHEGSGLEASEEFPESKETSPEDNEMSPEVVDSPETDEDLSEVSE